jgi:hypothetical protein
MKQLSKEQELKESSSYRSMHREASKYDKKDGLQYEIMVLKSKVKKLRIKQKAQLETMQIEMKMFYLDKIE